MGTNTRNTDWSKYVQSAELLCESRLLRFDDQFAAAWKGLFAISEAAEPKLLELGCGPGALASKLYDWYPNIAVTGIDRDSNFIEYADQRFNQAGRHITFVEGDATDTGFPADSYDIVISNTVSEHIETGAFFHEQRRILKPGGRCIVISTRKTLKSPEPEYDAYESDFWRRFDQIEQVEKSEPVEVCRYPLSESELPAVMESYGFCDITTGYVALDLTPDDPKYSPEFAKRIINSGLICETESVETLRNSYPGRFSDAEIRELVGHIEQRYKSRLNKYERGEKLWDTTILIIMVVRGTKPE